MKKELTNEGHRAFFKWLMTDGNCEDSKKVQEYLDNEFNNHPEYFVSETNTDKNEEPWIQIKEKLPENTDKHVLVYNANYAVNGDGISIYRGSYIHYILNNKGVTDVIPTHWRPLPAIPHKNGN